MTELVLKKGDIAVATLRTPAALAGLAAQWPPDRLCVLELDVTRAEDVARAFAEAKRAFGRIDVVFNNAGIVLVGEVEGTPDRAARDLFEVNFWGAATVSREAVRFFREENNPPGGRLLQNSSVAGYNATPVYGFYAASCVARLSFSLPGFSLLKTGR
jgi:NAD(P)-dependent dehydrogenase (short-subunit alcohol dehydrogenase family)